MLKEQILKLFKNNEFEKLEKLVKEQDLEILAKTLASLDKEFLVQIFPKLPEEISAEVFVKFPSNLQKYLLENISDYEFQPISEELLSSDIEDSVNKTVLNELLLKAEADTRHEKLVEIIENLENKNFNALKPLLAEMEPFDIAEICNELEGEKLILLFRILSKDLASETFANMDSDTQKALIKLFTDSELSFIINDLFVDDTVDLIEEMPSNIVIRILKLSNTETRENINKLLGFPKDSAGSIMTTEFVTLRSKMTVSDALKKIRRQAKNKETIYTCYVTDDTKKLLGIVSARDLLIHKETDVIKDFMLETFVSTHTHTDKEEVSNMLSKYDLLAIPVVDNEGRITGIVTIDDAIDVIQEEASEDISKMAGITPTTKPYFQTSSFKLFLSRVPWLLVLLISATFTGIIINEYEGTLNSLSPLLFACIPMLMGTGGNAGSQASVTIIQQIALDEVQFKDVFKVLWKEIRVAVLVALVLAVCCFGKLQLIDNLILGYDYSIKISVVVSLALFATICLAKIIGAFLPLLAKKCKLDPAVVANPFITTLIDIISLTIFCQFSILLL